MSIEYQSEGERPLGFLWSNSQRLSYFKFPDPNEKEKVDSSFLQKMQILKYSKRHEKTRSDKVGEPIKGLFLSQYYYFVLLPSGLSIFSRITQRMQEFLDLSKYGNMIGMIFDRTTHALTVYSDSFVGEISVVEEEKDIWRVYLDERKYKEAYEICKKHENPNSSWVLKKHLSRDIQIWRRLIRSCPCMLMNCSQTNNMKRLQNIMPGQITHWRR